MFRTPIYKVEQKNRPIQFLKDLNKYTYIHELDLNETRAIITQSLQDNALKWWTLNENEINNFNDFSRVFKLKFWSTIIQKNIKRKIEFSHFNINGKQTRTEYAIEPCTLAQDLDIKIIKKEV